MSSITAYEIEDIGIDHPQYFQGRSTSHTDWHNVVVGVGSDPLDAFDNAMQQLVDDDYMIDPIVENERALYKYATTHIIKGTRAFKFTSHWTPDLLHAEDCPSRKDAEFFECNGCELQYYIAIYVK